MNASELLTGTWLTAAEARDASYWARHLCRSVRLSESIETAWQDPDRVMLELGPGQTLCAYARQQPACGRERLSLVQPTLPGVHEPAPDAAVLLTSLGRLWTAGLELNWAGFEGTAAGAPAGRER